LLGSARNWMKVLASQVSPEPLIAGVGMENVAWEIGFAEEYANRRPLAFAREGSLKHKSPEWRVGSP
jgi:hypothetical protein